MDPNKKGRPLGGGGLTQIPEQSLSSSSTVDDEELKAALEEIRRVEQEQQQKLLNGVRSSVASAASTGSSLSGAAPGPDIPAAASKPTVSLYEELIRYQEEHVPAIIAETEGRPNLAEANTNLPSMPNQHHGGEIFQEDRKLPARLPTYREPISRNFFRSKASSDATNAQGDTKQQIRPTISEHHQDGSSSSLSSNATRGTSNTTNNNNNAGTSTTASPTSSSGSSAPAHIKHRKHQPIPTPYLGQADDSHQNHNRQSPPDQRHSNLGSGTGGAVVDDVNADMMPSTEMPAVGKTLPKELPVARAISQSTDSSGEGSGPGHYYVLQEQASNTTEEDDEPAPPRPPATSLRNKSSTTTASSGSSNSGGSGTTISSAALITFARQSTRFSDTVLSGRSRSAPAGQSTSGRGEPPIIGNDAPPSSSSYRSNYLEELQGERNQDHHTPNSPRQSLETFVFAPSPPLSPSIEDDEALARRLQAEMDAEAAVELRRQRSGIGATATNTTTASGTSTTPIQNNTSNFAVSDAELARHLAALILKEEQERAAERELQDRLQQEQIALGVTQIRDNGNGVSAEDQRRILEKIREEQERKQLEDVLSLSVQESGGSSHGGPGGPGGNIYNSNNGNNDNYSRGGSSGSSDLPYPTSRPSRTSSRGEYGSGGSSGQNSGGNYNADRRADAFDRQFRPRGPGAGGGAGMMFEPPPSARNYPALGGGGGGSMQPPRSAPSGYPPYDNQRQPQPWEISQQQAFAEFQRQQQQQQLPSRYPSYPSENPPYSWYPPHQGPQQPQPPPATLPPPYMSPLGTMAAQPREDLLRRGVTETERAVQQGRAHLVQCQGCYSRLHAPIEYALVYCPKCGVVSPGQSIIIPSSAVAADVSISSNSTSSMRDQYSPRRSTYDY